MAADMSGAMDGNEDVAANATANNGAADLQHVQDLVNRLKAS